VVWSYETADIPYEADRVPFGEQRPVPTFNGTLVDPVSNPPDDVPVLSLLLLGVKAVFPGTPYWFNELQLFLVLVGAATAFVGGLLRYRAG